MLRFGLCCAFLDQPIKFASTTAAAMSRLPRQDALNKLNQLCLANADALRKSLEYCHAHDIGCFRINSQILPLKTHPQCGYSVTDLPDGAEIIRRFLACGAFVRRHEMRTSFHPDQFVVLNSPRSDVIHASLQELEYQAEVAEWVGADVINIHGGGSYGDKSKALADLQRTIEQLPPPVRSRLTLENDDRTYTPADLLPVCKSANVPLVYDVHHHRCLADGYSVAETTKRAFDTWNREPMFHLSSPLEGWDGPRPQRHHDFINVCDFPEEWREQRLTIEVEAKAKESAVLRLIDELQNRPPRRAARPRHK